MILFDGFLKVYMEGKDDEDSEEQEGLLPDMKQGEHLRLREMTATQRFDRPSPRYTEASLVKKLEELGIGRPSTYAATISTVQKQGYVVKENREGTQAYLPHPLPGERRRSPRARPPRTWVPRSRSCSPRTSAWW